MLVPNGSGPAQTIVRALALAALCLGLLGCRGDRIAGVAMLAPGTGEARFTSDKTLSLWSDWSGEWEGGTKSHLPLAYEIEVLQGGAVVGKVSCDTKSIRQSVCSGGSSIFGHRTGACEDEMKCDLPDTKPGEITLRVTGRLLDPAKTKKVHKMHLNVRAK